MALLLLTSCGTGEDVDTMADEETTIPETTTTIPETTTVLETTTTVLGTTTEPEGPRGSGSPVLRGDGLGVVDFGQPADEVVQVLEAIIGSPPADPGGEAEWVEYVGWRNLGLSLGFDRAASLDFDGVSRFVGWSYGSPDGLELVTDEGIGIGSSLADVRAAYGDRLRVFSEPDECVGAWTFQLTSADGDVEISGTLDRQPADDALMTSAHAGLGLGC